MSLGDDLDLLSDLANIAAYRQRADMLANQAAQLDALRGIQQQTQIQALRAEREKVLQDTLFALRKSFPSLSKALENEPEESLESLFQAERTMALLPPTEFTGLEWKELSVTAREELNTLVHKMGVTHGDSMLQKLSYMLENAKLGDEEQRKREARDAWLRQEDFNKRKERQREIKGILTFFNILTLFALIGTIWLFCVVGLGEDGDGIAVGVVVIEITGAIVFNIYKLAQIR
jgi:hypothetical protein